MKLCGCGCGATVTSRKAGARFLHGHWARLQERRPLVDRFMEKTQPADDLSPNGRAGCVLWTGGLNSGGYGSIKSEDGRDVGAHVVAWRLAGRPIPENYHLDHLCRRPHCVNVEHLEPVTCAENQRRGLNTKLSAEQVANIRYLRTAGWNAEAVAGAYGVTRALVYAIARGKAWTT